MLLIIRSMSSSIQKEAKKKKYISLSWIQRSYRQVHSCYCEETDIVSLHCQEQTLLSGFLTGFHWSSSKRCHSCRVQTPSLLLTPVLAPLALLPRSGQLQLPIALTTEVKGEKQDHKACFLMLARCIPSFPLPVNTSCKALVSIFFQKGQTSNFSWTWHLLIPWSLSCKLGFRHTGKVVAEKLFHYCLHCVCE